MAGDETPRAEILGLVASAGGLGAVTTVLRALPPDLPAAIVVAQHLGGHGSKFVEILNRRIELPVVLARTGEPVVAGRVTVCPPRSRLEILPDRTCAVTPHGAARDERPLDALLESLAESVGDRAAGVVLTGMGNDGARGARALHEAGGLVIAQDEATAEHPDMPRAAAADGAVGLVLPLFDVGPALVDAAYGRRLPVAPAELRAIRDVFGSSGVTASIAGQLDWRSTPLGPVGEWSPMLRATLRLVMASPDPAAVFWGEELLFFSNDAAISMISGRESSAFARPYRESFAEVFEQAAPTFAHAMSGHAARHTALPFRYLRDGRMQDAWVDLSDTPIWEDGRVAGIQRVFYERTAEVLAARRLATLNALAGAPRTAGRREALSAALGVLEGAEDVPFAVGFLLDPMASRAGLVGAVGVEAGGAMAPREVRLGPSAAWPMHEVLESRRPLVVDDLAARFRGHLVGAGRSTPESAIVYALRDDASDRAAAILILGVDPYLGLDDRYREFLALAADTIAARMSEAHAHHRERQRREQLAELDRAKTEFFSNVSHEFRTPLTLMLGPLDAVLERGDELPADLVRELDVARRNAQRLLRLTGALLDFSQVEAGRLRARLAPVDLAERTREIVAQFEGAVARAGLSLQTAIEPVGEPVWVDLEMWEKIVANLLSNALKFTFDGEIEVTLRKLPKHAELVVRDSGVGVPDEELPYIFKRFHRVRSTRARTHEGAGIGLALVDALVRRHHGRVRATSAVGSGTTFTVWIPLGPRRTDDEPQAAGTGVAEAMAEEASHWDAGRVDAGAEAVEAAALRSFAPGAHVLVVDDNPDMRDYLARLLGATWTVAVARDGEQALALARDAPPDLVVADVMMPRLDGFGLLAALRGDARLKTTPVVLVTARAGEETAIEGLLAGADDYIVKPFSARELVARVGGQLELARARRRAAELNAFRIGLSDALRELSDPLEIQRTACRLLLEQLGADRARFVEMDEADGQFLTMGGDTRPPMPGGYGRYAIDAFEPLARAIRAGRRLAIEDTQTDPYVHDIRHALAELQIGAHLVLPLVRQGHSSVALAVHQRTPRRWTTEEIAIAEEAAGRAWAEVERARAEAALRESEQRYRALAQASHLEPR